MNSCQQQWERKGLRLPPVPRNAIRHRIWKPGQTTRVSYSAVSEKIPTVIPHAEFGAPNCCGCLVGAISSGTAEIICNECGDVIAYVTPENLRQVLSDMESQLDLATALCRHCGAVNLLPGFSHVNAFVCQTCGKANG